MYDPALSDTVNSCELRRAAGGDVWPNRVTNRTYLAMVCCVGMSCLFHACNLPLVFGFPDFPATGVFSFACLVFAVLIWMHLVRQRFVRREIWLFFRAIAALILMWLLCQMAKNEYANEATTVARYLWYLYYVPITMIPPLLMMATLFVGEPATWHLGARWWLLLIMGAGISALVVSNDLHQLVFSFEGALQEGIAYDAPQNHAMGPLYYLVWGWVTAVGVAVLVALVRHGAHASLLRDLKAPFAVMALMILILPSYGKVSVFPLGRVLKFTEATCVFMIAFMESLVASGLLPTNSGYGFLWKVSSLKGGFVDGFGMVTNVANGTPKVTAEQVERAVRQPLLLDRVAQELAARRVQGGTVYWVRDLTQVRALLERLEEIGDSLAAEQVMLQAENDLAKSREEVAQRQRLYELVVANTASQLAALRALLDTAPQDEGAFLDQMHQAAVLAAYIKRCANLTLLGEGMIDVRELLLAIEESAGCLRACGVDARVDTGAKGVADASAVTAAYASLEDAIEEALPFLKSMRAWVDDKDGAPILRARLVSDKHPDVNLVLTLGGDDS